MSKMKRPIWIMILIIFLTILMVYSGARRPPRETRMYDLVNNPSSFDNQEVLVSGRVIETINHENGTTDITIGSGRKNEVVLLVVNTTELNIMPKKWDSIESIGKFHNSESHPHIKVTDIHVRTRWGQRLIYLRSIAAIPLILYFIRQNRDLLRV